MRNATLVTLVALVGLLGACSTTRTPASAGAAGTVRPVPGAATSSPQPGGKATSTVDPTATPVSSVPPETEDRRCIGLRFVSDTRGLPDAPHIFARPDVVQAWYCGNIVPGRECRIGWNGSYAGADHETYIRLVTWERGKPVPMVSPEVGPLPLEGQFTTTSTKFSYIVGKVDKVRFYLELLDSRKAVIATSDTFVYNVLCKG